MQARQNHILGVLTLEVRLFHWHPRPFPPWELTAPYSPGKGMGIGVDEEQLTLNLHFPSPQQVASITKAESPADPQGWHNDEIPISSLRNQGPERCRHLSRVTQAGAQCAGVTLRPTGGLECGPHLLGVPVCQQACGHRLVLLRWPRASIGQSCGEGTPRRKGCLAGVLSERPSWPPPKPPTASHISEAS